VTEPNYIRQLRDILGDIRSAPGYVLREDSAVEAARSRKRAAVQALIEHGATEGERSAARAAMGRLDDEAEREEQDRLEAEEIEAVDEWDEEDYIPL
jgi:hypothetical protein